MLLLSLTEALKSVRFNLLASRFQCQSQGTVCHQTCFSVFSKSVCTHFRCVAFYFLNNFPNCFSPESRLWFTPTMNFFVSQLKALRIRAKGYPSDLRLASFFEESHFSSCSPSTFIFFYSNTTGVNRGACLMLKHFHCSCTNLLLHISNLSRTLHCFPSI